MKLGRLVLGLAAALSVGILLFGLGAAIGPTVTAAPAASSHAVAQIQFCAVSVKLVPSSASTFAGQPMHFQTQVSFQSPTCGFYIPATYHYYNLPIGCQAQNLPALTCVPMGVGVFHPTVIVSLPWVSVPASTTVAIWGAN